MTINHFCFIFLHVQYIHTHIFKDNRLINTYLHCAIGQLHYHGCLSSKPLVYIRYSRKRVTLFHCNRATRLHQVLIHVFHKEVHQFHFLFEIDRTILDRVVQLIALAIDIMNIVTIRHHNQPRAVVVHHADAIIRQLISETILIRVVHPFANPNHRLRCRISQFVCKFSKIFITILYTYFKYIF